MYTLLYFHFGFKELTSAIAMKEMLSIKVTDKALAKNRWNNCDAKPWGRTLIVRIDKVGRIVFVFIIQKK